MPHRPGGGASGFVENYSFLQIPEFTNKFRSALQSHDRLKSFRVLFTVRIHHLEGTDRSEHLDLLLSRFNFIVVISRGQGDPQMEFDGY